MLSRCVLCLPAAEVASAPPPPAPCRQLGLGNDKNRWAPKLLPGLTIIHPDRTLRRNRKPALKALLLQDEAPHGGTRLHQ